MPPPPPPTATPSHKRRVRTGCLTCRRRRRKCDEGKPSCENCRDRGFSCTYGAEVTFVSAAKSREQGPNTVSNTNTTLKTSYSTITFVADDVPVPLTPASSSQRTLPQPQQIIVSREIEANNAPRFETVPTPRPSAEPAVWNQGAAASSGAASHIGGPYGTESPRRNDGVAPGAAAKQRDASDHLTRTTPIIHHLNHDSSFSPTFASPFNVQLNDGVPWARNEDEIDLLRHFRYRLSPLLDLGDPLCFFGIEVMVMAKSSRLLRAAILALSAFHQSSMPHGNRNSNRSQYLRLAEEAKQSLVLERHELQCVGKTLLALKDFLVSSPLQWENFIRDQTGILDDPNPLADMQARGLEHVFWLYLRIDLAASIASAHAPLIPLSFLQQTDSMMISGPFPFHNQFAEPSGKQIHQRSLTLLAGCLSFIFSDPPELSRENHLEQFATHQLSANPDSPLWMRLWTDCQKWYENRPSEMQEILHVSGGEADQIDAHNSSFPILIYTTPLALLSNAVYHIACFILLTHRPKLLKFFGTARRFTSHIWHAHSIVGIATSNEFLEQWDPILVAGLLLIAKALTHESQQSLMLEQLRRIARSTSLMLDAEIEALITGWKISRGDEETGS